MKQKKPVQTKNTKSPEEIVIMQHLPEPKPVTFQVNDLVLFSFQEYKVVEIVCEGQVHIKNLTDPFDSQVVYNTQITKVNTET